MKNSIYSLLVWLAMGLTACDSEPKFKVEGSIQDADKETLYLEASTLEGVVLLDSIKLEGQGRFAFKGNKPESPEFYRLRLGQKVVNFSIDSTETVTVNGKAASWETQYDIEGSDNSKKIKELVLLQSELQQKMNQLGKEQLPVGIAQERVAQWINEYKTKITHDYIFAEPNKAYAYFALYQQLNGYLIFDPLSNKEDLKCFAAVATSLNNNYPHANRSRNLYNVVIKGMKNTRSPREQAVELPENVIKETSLIDIELRDIKGNLRKLTDLKGKVVLLDFTVYNNASSAAHNLALRELYAKYAEKGLEIYQVSLDENEHFWKTAASNLPWVCVRDARGSYSTYLSLYNVTELPALFVVDKENELRSRGNNLAEMELAIKELVK
ncbi:MAG: thioredoxin-like domain-containing protein [Phocaeicola sp.]